MYDYENEPQGAVSVFELKRDKRMRRFLESIKDVAHPSVLEVGMGQGGFLKKFSTQRPDSKIFGIDISKTAIEVARDEISFNGEFMVGDAQEIPYPADYFDVVVIMDVLEHLKDIQKAIQEAKRVLKPGGIFHFYFPCEGEPGTLDWFIRRTNFLSLRDFSKIHFGHIHHLSQSEIKEITAQVFTNIDITYSTHWVSQIVHVLTLYIPKRLIEAFIGEKKQREIRDAYRPAAHNGKASRPLKVMKNMWLIFVAYPASLIYEIEAYVLKFCSLGAQGMHFTCRK